MALHDRCWLCAVEWGWLMPSEGDSCAEYGPWSGVGWGGGDKVVPRYNSSACRSVSISKVSRCEASASSCAAGWMRLG